MAVQVTAIMIGVEDLARSKTFYGEGLGCTIDQDYPNFVSFNLGEGSSSLALYPREAAAQPAGGTSGTSATPTATSGRSHRRLDRRSSTAAGRRRGSRHHRRDPLLVLVIGGRVPSLRSAWTCRQLQLDLNLRLGSRLKAGWVAPPAGR